MKPGSLLLEAGRCLIARATQRISKSGVQLIRAIRNSLVLTSQRTQCEANRVMLLRETTCVWYESYTLCGRNAKFFYVGTHIYHCALCLKLRLMRTLWPRVRVEPQPHQ